MIVRMKNHCFKDDHSVVTTTTYSAVCTTVSNDPNARAIIARQRAAGWLFTTQSAVSVPGAMRVHISGSGRPPQPPIHDGPSRNRRQIHAPMVVAYNQRAAMPSRACVSSHTNHCPVRPLAPPPVERMLSVEEAELLERLPPREEGRGLVADAVTIPTPSSLVEQYVANVVGPQVRDAAMDAARSGPDTEALLQLMDNLVQLQVASPVQATDVARCAPSVRPSSFAEYARVLYWLNGKVTYPVTEALLQRALRIEGEVESWGRADVLGDVSTAHFAAYVLLKTAGVPALALPGPRTSAVADIVNGAVAAAVKCMP